MCPIDFYNPSFVKERIEKYWDKLFADPLVVYVDGKEKLVFEDESKIAKRFSKVDICEIRKILAKQHSRKQLLGTRKTKRFIRQPKFKDKSVQHFLPLPVQKYRNPTKFCDQRRNLTDFQP